MVPLRDPETVVATYEPERRVLDSKHEFISENSLPGLLIRGMEEWEENRQLGGF